MATRLSSNDQTIPATSPLPISNSNSGNLEKTVQKVANEKLSNYSHLETFLTGLDLMGGLRQIPAILSTIVSKTMPAVAGAAGTVNPIASVIMGPCFAGLGFYLMPTCAEALGRVEDKVIEMENMSETGESLEEEKRERMLKRLDMANVIFLTHLGVGFSAAGIAGFGSSAIANVFHYTPFLAGTAGALAGLVINIFIAVCCFGWGSVMLARGIGYYRRTDEFSQELNTEISIDAAMKMLQEKNKIDSYLKRRIEGIDKINLNSENKLDTLKEVDKAIYRTKLKQKLIIALGVILLGLGVIFTILAFANPLVAAILGLIVAGVFIAATPVFLSHDQSKFFNWIVEQLYCPSEWLLNLQQDNNQVDSALDLN